LEGGDLKIIMILEAMRTKQLMSQVLFGSKGDVGFVCPFMHLMIGINIDNWNHGENYRTLRSIFGEDYEKLVLDATREEQFLELKTKALQTFTVKGEELNSRLRMLPGKSGPPSSSSKTGSPQPLRAWTANRSLTAILFYPMTSVRRATFNTRLKKKRDS
jgi:hypothetical protein